MALARLAERARVFWSSNEGVGSNPTSDIKFLRFSALTLKYAHFWGKIRQGSTPGGTRTLNPRFRRPMPYPLGHRGYPQHSRSERPPSFHIGVGKTRKTTS